LLVYIATGIAVSGDDHNRKITC